MSHMPAPANWLLQDSDRTARASGSVTVLSLDEAARAARSLHPPPAYRLSLDSGVEYKNVRRALAQPLGVRVPTWQRILASLGLRMVAAGCVEDVIWPGTATIVVGFDADAAALAAPPGAVGLRAYRLAHGWSRRELARRSGVSVEALDSAENGRGDLRRLTRLCETMELRLLVVLPPGHDTLESLWRERSARCLEEPAQYRTRRRGGP